jgi:O-antigen ligase
MAFPIAFRVGTQIRLRAPLAIGLGAAVWLCPLWLTPTPAVPTLLWGGLCLGAWLILDGCSTPPAEANLSIQKLFWLLLISLAGMIAWRSRELQNTLAAGLCLLGIGLATKLSAKVDKEEIANTLAWSWLIAGLANSVVGLVQYFGQTAEPLGTAFGLLRQRNHLSTLCNIALLSLLYLWTRHQTKPNPLRVRGQFLTGLACALLTAALAATCSRAGLLELIVSLVLIVAYAVRKRHHKLLLVAAFTTLFYVAWAYLLPQLSHSPETIFGRMLQTATVTSDTAGMDLQYSRSLLWSNTLTLIQAHPVLGVGWRELAFSLRTTDFESAIRFAEQADNAHNLPLQLAVELGLPFAALWLSLLAWLIARNKPWQARVPAQLLAWGILIIIGIHSLLEYPLWYSPFQIALGLCAGLVFSQSNQKATTHVSGLDWQKLAGISLIFFCAYAAFDYHRIRQLFIADNERSYLYQGNVYNDADASWLFAAQVRFATFATTPVTLNNAAQLQLLGQEVLHFSPEPLVFNKLNEVNAHTLK